MMAEYTRKWPTKTPQIGDGTEFGIVIIVNRWQIEQHFLLTSRQAYLEIVAMDKLSINTASLNSLPRGAYTR